jgi:hypothetical protein
VFDLPNYMSADEGFASAVAKVTRYESRWNEHIRWKSDLSCLLYK